MSQSGVIQEYLDAWKTVLKQSCDALHKFAAVPPPPLDDFSKSMAAFADTTAPTHGRATQMLNESQQPYSPVAVRLVAWETALRKVQELMLHHEEIEASVEAGSLASRLPGRQQRVRGREHDIGKAAGEVDSLQCVHHARQKIAWALNVILGHATVSENPAFVYRIKGQALFEERLARLPEGEKTNDVTELAGLYDKLGEMMVAFSDVEALLKSAKGSVKTR